MNDPWYVVAFGTTLGALTIFFPLVFFIIWLKRALFFENVKLEPKKLEALKSNDFRKFLRSKINFSISDEEIDKFISVEHQNLKIASVNTAGKFYNNLRPKLFFALRMKTDFESLKLSQIVKILNTEENYICNTVMKKHLNESTQNVLLVVIIILWIMLMFGLMLWLGSTL